ncbi:unnamed protein product [Phytophthora fragariaefolia]|uniref:Unnamed protein product n=1 Tax=Phytophthora fragariaefolia TaxID=1490495 RepID=A0A9W6YP71_9STRA|nr:unnamed protein product [Phytophthora fragariaefolia]
MKTDHIKYTAFQEPSGLYEYLVLPMGVSNAPATMHRLTSALFKGLSHTISYDDIHIFTKTRDINEHLQAIRDVMEILKVNKLYVKLSKSDRTTVYPVKDEEPTELEDLIECGSAKELLRTDAIQFADSSVLFQVVDGVERLIAYTSRKMKSAELKYPTQQQELLTIVNALAAFRIYCLDRPVMIETDHKSLEGIFQQKMANRRLARWYDILAEYQPVFGYLPGADNGITDALSRRPDLKPKTNEFHDLFVPSFNETSYQLRVTEIRPTSDLIKAIIEGYKK